MELTHSLNGKQHNLLLTDDDLEELKCLVKDHGWEYALDTSRQWLDKLAELLGVDIH